MFVKQSIFLSRAHRAHLSARHVHVSDKRGKGINISRRFFSSLSLVCHFVRWMFIITYFSLSSHSTNNKRRKNMRIEPSEWMNQLGRFTTVKYADMSQYNNNNNQVNSWTHREKKNFHIYNNFNGNMCVICGAVWRYTNEIEKISAWVHFFLSFSQFQLMSVGCVLFSCVKKKDFLTLKQKKTQ